MNENEKGKNAVMYEYKTVSVPHAMGTAYTDGYTNFGWEFCGKDFNISTPFSQGEAAVELKFRRDRRMEHKEELRNLEKQFDGIAREIHKIEWKKAAGDMGKMLGFGIVGAGFLTGAIFSFIGSNILLGIILLIPSLAGWGFGYFNYRRSQKDGADKATPQIDSHYDALYDLCKKGQVLLAGSAS
jgi:hypothetical protein